MMRTLLYKQLRLVCHPMTPVFCMFGVMLMIPNYPLTVVWFYVMLGLFFTFLNMREQKDIYYSAILPIRKRDTVKAACLFTALIELASLVIAAPFAVWRAHVHRRQPRWRGRERHALRLRADALCAVQRDSALLVL